MNNVHILDASLTSKLIDLSSFLEKHNVKSMVGSTPFCQEPMNVNERRCEIKKLMGCEIDEQHLKKLEIYCSPENLLSEPDVLPLYDESHVGSSSYNPIKITEDGLKLKTVSKLQERLKNDTKKKLLKNIGHITPSEKYVVPDHPPNLIPGEEMLITIRLYKPYTYSAHHKVGLPVFDFDIVVLGSQKLDVLRDHITCSNDLGVLNDLSENPDLEKAIYSMDVYKSGFLFIEDTFYNDTREKDNIDYSACIRDWAVNKKEIGPLKTAVMEDTRFDQLKIHLGRPQVYQHRGNCEHIFVFSDVEVLRPSDICYSARYPYYKAMRFKHGRYCNICGLFMAKWFVQNSNRVPFDPALFCESCFQSYNYLNGKKIGEFKAYPYFDQTSIL